MSKKTSISKRGGHPAGALHDVTGMAAYDAKSAAQNGATSRNKPQALMHPDPLDAFDALLPVCEEASAAGANQMPVGNRTQVGPRETPVHCEHNRDEPLPCDSEFPGAESTKLISTQPIASVISEKLNSQSPAPILATEQVELIESLRYWESELHRTEADLQQKSADLAARRRDLARQVRAWRRETQRPPNSPDAANQNPAIAADSDLRLAEMQSQIEMLVTLLRDAWPSSGQSESACDSHSDAGETHFGLDADAKARLQLASEKEAENVAEIDSLRSQLESLVEQNNQLATELAHLTVQRTVDQSSDATASMSWEERKELLYRQFESEDNGKPLNPEQLSGEQCARLNHELVCMQQELRSRDSEIAELRSLLEQRPEIEDSDLAVGAAAITRLFDDDELIREERSRLKEIQSEWEVKFRDMEIAASIERASLARERRQLECQNAELEEQLAHLKQELRQESIAGPAQTRRWFAKLGLGD